jgi:hypothetical protein
MCVCISIQQYTSARLFKAWTHDMPTMRNISIITDALMHDPEREYKWPWQFMETSKSYGPIDSFDKIPSDNK